MSKKSEQAAKLLEKVELPHGVPEPMAQGTLLQQGLYVVLLRHMPPPRAEAAVQALDKAFSDWNELRVCQSQEIAVHIAPKGTRTPDKLRKFLPAASAVRDYLQEIYQKTHALNLAELAEDAVSAGKLVGQMPYLGSIASTLLLWLAHDRALPVTPGLVRVLDRIGMMARTASPKKARAAMEPLVPKNEPLRFAMGFGFVAEKWCHARNPICWECPLRDDCQHGKKVVKDWKVQQERLEVQRKKDDARRAAQELKDKAREERERKRADEARKRQAEKDARANERKLAAEKKAAEKRAADKKDAAKAAPAKPSAKPAAKGAAKGTDKKPAAAKASTKTATKKPASKAAEKKAAEKKPTDKKADKKAGKKADKKNATPKKPAKTAGGKAPTGGSKTAAAKPARKATTGGGKTKAKTGSRKPATTKKPTTRRK